MGCASAESPRCDGAGTALHLRAGEGPSKGTALTERIDLAAGLPLRPSFASFSSCLIMINKKLLLMSDVM